MPRLVHHDHHTHTDTHTITTTEWDETPPNAIFCLRFMDGHNSACAIVLSCSSPTAACQYYITDTEPASFGDALPAHWPTPEELQEAEATLSHWPSFEVFHHTLHHFYFNWNTRMPRFAFMLVVSRQVDYDAFYYSAPRALTEFLVLTVFGVSRGGTLPPEETGVVVDLG